MYINKLGEVKVRIKGIDRTLRELANTNDDTLDAARSGVHKAAEYLMEVIKEKFGVYQDTGGNGGGAWARLKFETIQRKMRKYGVGDKPLIASGEMRDSFYIKEGGEGTIAASVASRDPKLIHHIYGAPRAGVPRRDPMLVTAVEEHDMCHDIVEDEINDVL
jgi:hypothetical protein